MDIFYYSNYCKHCQKLLQYLSKTNMTSKINFICIDSRKKDPMNGQTLITLENGKKVALPPNISSVPSLLLINQNYKVLLGDDIFNHYAPTVQTESVYATRGNGEPQAFQLKPSGLSNANVISEQFTFYNMSPEELSAKGNGGMRQLHNYVDANHNKLTMINTPEDTYRPDKLSNNVTIDSLQQKRMSEIGETAQPSIFTGI